MPRISKQTSVLTILFAIIFIIAVNFYYKSHIRNVVLLETPPVPTTKGTNNRPLGVAITVSFNYKNDPQTHQRIQPTYDYIKPWYESLRRNSKMSGVVIEDTFDTEFRSKYSTDQISFVHINSSKHPAFDDYPNSNERSINDQRFFVIYWYITEFLKDHEYVVLTDSRDVRFLRNPFEFFRGMDRTLGSRQLYVSEEYEPQAHSFVWNHKHWQKCFNEPETSTVKMYNPGVIGGRVDVIKTLLSRMLDLFSRRTPVEEDCNMQVLQKVLRENFQDNVISGYPLHTKFGANETNDFAFIKHK